jgi:hypothetical protein
MKLQDITRVYEPTGKRGDLPSLPFICAFCSDSLARRRRAGHFFFSSLEGAVVEFWKHLTISVLSILEEEEMEKSLWCMGDCCE